ncbi:hypothetical protein [Paenibacillus xylanexedens]|uniref:hypothetical protein n=1 Tax=Paenibacillus xylanexedens TaxID=528191 RepID=UPI0009385BDE|nr:hypothetical protein [Paenibacillus xylanexedens]APO43322.1 hypothetical protein BS614_04140 [Paenibacillus xylanexedens]
MHTKLLTSATLFVSFAVLFFAVVFLFKGTNDINNLSEIFEKVTSVNFTLAIGYSALLAAVAALASHNTRQDRKIKQDILDFIYITVFYVLLNLMILIVSFILNEFYSALMGRTMIVVLIIILLIYSNLLLKTLKQLIF